MPRPAGRKGHAPGLASLGEATRDERHVDQIGGHEKGTARPITTAIPCKPDAPLAAGEAQGALADEHADHHRHEAEADLGEHG